MTAGYQFGQFQCARQVLETLEKWKSKDDWRPSAPTAEGNMVLTSPTAEFGSWIEVLMAPTGGKVALRLIRDESEIFVSYNHSPECRPSIAARSKLPLKADPKKIPAYWTDQKIGNFIKQSKTGFIYLWSPHMPYSWKGVEEVRKIALKHPKLSIEIMMDPNGDPQVAKKITKINGWPSDYLKKADSTEFVMRGFYLHAPTLIPFKNREFGFHLPGYRDAQFMSKFLKKTGVL